MYYSPELCFVNTIVINGRPCVDPLYGPLFFPKVRTEQRIMVENYKNPHFGPLFSPKVRTKQRTMRKNY